MPELYYYIIVRRRLTGRALASRLSEKDVLL